MEHTDTSMDMVTHDNDNNVCGTEDEVFRQAEHSDTAPTGTRIFYMGWTTVSVLHKKALRLLHLKKL